MISIGFSQDFFVSVPCHVLSAPLGCPSRFSVNKCFLKLMLLILTPLIFMVKSSFQIYADFEEIRHEIETETERISGSNKVSVKHEWRKLMSFKCPHQPERCFIMFAGN